MREKSQISRYLSLLCLGLIFSLGLHLRLTTVLESEVIHPIRADAKEYVLYAINLNKYATYSRSTDELTDNSRPIPDAARPPGYPLFLALFINDSTLKKISLSNILITQACLSAIVILFVYGIFASCLGNIAAISITALVAISPHLINANIYFLSESLFSILLIFFFWLLNKLNTLKGQFLLSFVLGTVLAIASLTRPWLQYFIFMLLPLVFFSVQKTARIKITLLLAGAFFLSTGIWTLRNYYTLGNLSNDSVMISSILHGMYPDLMYQGDPQSYGFPYRYDPNKSAITSSLSSLLMELSNRFQNAPWQHIRWYLIGKPITLFSWSYIQGMGDSFIYPVQKSPYFTSLYFQLSHAFMKLSHSFFMCLALLGSIMVWFPKNKINFSGHSLFTLRCISLLIVYFILIHILVAPLPRYAVPIRPLMYGMAIFSIVQILYWVKNKTILK